MIPVSASSEIGAPRMRRILLAAMSTLAAVVVLFGYRTSSPVPTSTAVASAGAADDPGATDATTPAAPVASTVLGQVSHTRWGPVQVQITVSGRTVTAATAVQVPNENRRDVEINARAVPVLEQEALQAQSADIDGVSGATLTSEGYVASLQSALDQAGL